MSEHQETPRKWRDGEDNTYAVEKTVRNGRFVVVRYNGGGNRKAARQFTIVGNQGTVQRLLNAHAERNGWKEVAG